MSTFLSIQALLEEGVPKRAIARRLGVDVRTVRKHERRIDQGASGLLRLDGSLPGYTVFDLRGGVRLTKDVRLEIALENLSDKKYRRLHSRMDAPGFNVRVGMTFDF